MTHHTHRLFVPARAAAQWLHRAHLLRSLTAAAFLLAASSAAPALLGGCATGENLGSTEDTGRVGSVRDASADGGRGGGARDSGVDRDLGETVQDVTLDSGDGDGSGDAGETGDAAAADATNADTSPDVDWQPVVHSNPLVPETVEASRTALTAYCACCVSRFASDPALCLSTAFEGGFAASECHLEAYTRMGATADPYLTCMQAAWDELTACNQPCANNCALCENNFNFAQISCGNANPSVTEQLALCAE